MSNPFAALLGEKASENRSESTELCETIENVFGFTLNKARSEVKKLLYLEDQAASFPGQDLDLSILEHALFERLLIPVPNNSSSYKFENRTIKYLFACYNNNIQIKGNSACATIKLLIMRNVLTSLKQPDLFSDQDVFAQFYDIMKNAEVNSELFFDDIYKSTLEDGGI